METTSTATAETYTVKRSAKWGGDYQRVAARCPSGKHEIGTAHADSRLGRAWLAGDFSEEWCTPCKWEGSVAA